MSFSDKREKAISVAKGALSSVFKEGLVEHYLNIQSDFKDLSVLDVLYLAKTSPNERTYKSYEDWNNNENLKIKHNEEGTVFPQFGTGVYFTRNQTEPKKGNRPDENKGSKEKSSSETKKLSVYKHKSNLTLREKMRALLANNQTRLGMTENPERTHGKAAYFDAELNAVIVNKNSTPEEIYRQLAEELAHAEFSHSDNNYTREKYEPLAQMSAYVICRRNAVKTGTITFPDDYKSLSDDEISGKLVTVKSCTDSMTDNIDYYYDNGKDRQERYTPKIRIELEEIKEPESQPKSTEQTEKSLSEAEKQAEEQTREAATKADIQSEKPDTKNSESSKQLEERTRKVFDKNENKDTPKKENIQSEVKNNNTETVSKRSSSTKSQISVKREMARKKYEAKHAVPENTQHAPKHLAEAERTSENTTKNKQGDITK